VTVYVNDSNGDPVALFGGSITDIIVGVQSGGSIGITQTISITALGALSRLPKVLTEGVLVKELDGEQIYDVLAGILYGAWNEVPAALTWAAYDPTTTWANAENSGLGEIDAGNYELTARSASVTDAYTLVAALANSGLGYLYENGAGQISYADSTHRSSYLATNGYVDLSANNAFASGLQLATRSGDVRNSITIQYKNGQQVSDFEQESIDIYGTLAQSIQTTLEHTADATAQAAFYLSLRAYPRPIFDQITFALTNPELDNGDRDSLINVFMGQPISLADLPPNMSAGNFLGFVEGWTFRASYNELAVTLSMTPLAFSLQAMQWQDVSVSEHWSTISATLDWEHALVVA
jgi:hypothetical protein